MFGLDSDRLPARRPSTQRFPFRVQSLVQAWRGISLFQKMLFWGVAIVFMVMGVIMVITYVSAEDSLRTQMQRQVGNELRVLDRLLTARIQTLLGEQLVLSREPALRGPHAAAILALEQHSEHLAFLLLLDSRGQVLAAASARPPGFDAALVAWILSRREQASTLEALGTPAAPHVVTVTPLENGPGALRLVAGERLPTELAFDVVRLLGGASAVFVQDRERTWRGVAAGLPRAADHVVLASGIAAAVSAGHPVFAETDLVGVPYMTAYQRLADHGGHDLAIVMRGLPRRQISEVLQHHAWTIFLFSGTAMLAAFIALIGLSRRLVQPIRQLARASRRMVEGNFSEPLPTTQSQDEVGRLSREFQRLADQLMEAKETSEAYNQQLKGLLEKVFTAQEDERKRIARELHDQTGQALTSLLVGLKVLEGARKPDEIRLRTAELKAIAVHTLEEVRKLSLELRPSMLDDLGLVPSLRSYCKDFATKHGVAVSCEVRGVEGRLPPLLEVALYRVVQEALTNVAKYARASRVAVSLVGQPDGVAATVSDDGMGFDPQVVLVQRAKEHRLGILGMQERIALLGGRFSLTSAPGAGTTVSIWAPLPRPQATTFLEAS